MITISHVLVNVLCIRNNCSLMDILCDIVSWYVTVNSRDPSLEPTLSTALLMQKQ